jgi:hypothetical protein
MPALGRQPAQRHSTCNGCTPPRGPLCAQRYNQRADTQSRQLCSLLARPAWSASEQAGGASVRADAARSPPPAPLSAVCATCGCQLGRAGDSCCTPPSAPVRKAIASATTAPVMGQPGPHRAPPPPPQARGPRLGSLLASHQIGGADHHQLQSSCVPPAAPRLGLRGDAGPRPPGGDVLRQPDRAHLRSKRPGIQSDHHQRSPGSTVAALPTQRHRAASRTLQLLRALDSRRGSQAGRCPSGKPSRSPAAARRRRTCHRCSATCAPRSNGTWARSSCILVSDTPRLRPRCGHAAARCGRRPTVPSRPAAPCRAAGAAAATGSLLPHPPMPPSPLARPPWRPWRVQSACMPADAPRARRAQTCARSWRAAAAWRSSTRAT